MLWFFQQRVQITQSQLPDCSSVCLSFVYLLLLHSLIAPERSTHGAMHDVATLASRVLTMTLGSDVALRQASVPVYL